MTDQPITHEWLKGIGFHWHEVERSGKHWLLWIGDARAPRGLAYPTTGRD